MDFYTFGPYLLAIFSATCIALYTWNKLRVLSFILVGWAIAAFLAGQFYFFAGLPSWQKSDVIGFMLFGTFAFAPAALMVIASLRVKTFKSFLDKTPLSLLVITQVYRIGGIFLILAYFRNLLPASIGLVSGILDVFVAITALLLAVYIHFRQSYSPKIVTGWAAVSLLDFAWATLIIFLSFFGVISLNPPPIQMGNPPLVVISLFAMPFGIFISTYVILLMLRLSPKKSQEGEAELQSS